MRSATSSMEVNIELLSSLLGNMEYRKQNNPYKNDRTGEITTKLIMLSDKMDDMFEVTVNGEITDGTYHKGQELDFKDCMVTFRASGAKGWEGAVNGILNVAVKANEVIVKEDTFPNEVKPNEVKSNTGTVKPDEKQQNKK